MVIPSAEPVPADGRSSTSNSSPGAIIRRPKTSPASRTCRRRWRFRRGVGL